MPRPRRHPSEEPVCIDLTSEPSSDSSSDDHEVLNEIAGNPITSEHVAILRTGAWFNDEIINAYLHTLSSPHTAILSSLLCALVNREGSDSPAVHRWLDRLGVPLSEERRLVLLPVNLHNTHWALLAFDVKGRRLMYYDSMLHKRSANNVLAKYLPLIQYLVHDNKKNDSEPSDGVEGIAGLLGGLSLDPSPTITLVIPEGQPRQLDGSSCGAFVCKWSELLSRAYATDPPAPLPSFTQRQVTQHRQHILDTLLAYKPIE